MAGCTIGLVLLLASGAAVRSRGAVIEQPSAAQQFEKAVTLMESRQDFAAAAELFSLVADGGDRQLAARALVHLGSCYERLGEPRARAVYRRVIERYPDQPEAVTQARARLDVIGRSATASRNLTLRRLWNKPPLPFTELGRPSFDGRFLPLTTPDGKLALQDLTSGTVGPPMELDPAIEGRERCLPWSLPVLAPDARSFVFNCQLQGERFEVWIAQLPPSAPARRLLLRASPGDFVEPREWRRPGEILAQVTHADRSAEIVVLPVGGGAPRRLVSLPTQAEGASLSPDGRWLAYDARDHGQPQRRDILVVRTDGGAPITIAGGPTDDLFPMWTPDGSGLLFVSDRTGSTGLWLQMIADGVPRGAPRLLTADLGRIADPLGVTAQGAFVYFRQTGLVDVQVVGLDARGDPVGEPSASGTHYAGANMFPAWSADGSRLAYRTELIGSRVHAIGVRDIVSGRERIVPAALAWIEWPRWSPDGTRLLVRGRDTAGQYGFFVVSLADGRTSAVKLVSLNEEDSLGSAQWAPGGDAIIYYRGNPEQFIRRDIPSGEEQVFATFESGAALQILPDPGFALGRDGIVAFVKFAKKTARTSLSLLHPDGTVQDVLTSESGERFAGVAWMPDHSAVLFTRAKTDRALSEEARWPSVWRLDVASGRAEPLGIAMRSLRNIAVSPDGRRLAFTAGSPTREPWILEHFLTTTKAPTALRRSGPAH